MGNTCPDICDALLVAMCHKCPNFKQCQNYEDECNHDQMLECINKIVGFQYPTTFEDVDGVQHTREELRLNGQTADEWADELFRYQYCDACGHDKDMHDIIPVEGNWFARCKVDNDDDEGETPTKA